MEIQAIILDRDGVLADFDYVAANGYLQPLLPLSLLEISDQWEAWGAKVGFPRNLAEERRFFAGFWDSLCVELALDAATCRQLHEFDYMTCMRAFPEVREILQLARQRGLRVGVLSNFSLASLDASLQAIGLAGLIDVALAAPIIGVAKPERAAYMAAANALDIAPRHCLFFDDELMCVKGAEEAQMRAYHVDRERSSHSLADGVVCDLTALADILNIE